MENITEIKQMYCHSVTEMANPKKIQIHDFFKNEIETKKFDISDFLSQYEKYVDTTWINISDISKAISNELPEKMTMNSIYNYIANYCATKIPVHPDFNVLASRICMDRLHMTTFDSFSECVERLFLNIDSNGRSHPLVSKHLYNFVMENKEEYDKLINHEMDYRFDFFGIKTLERSYLLKSHDPVIGKITIERPQYMLLRLGLGIHGSNIATAKETYDLVSNGYFTHATPTLFNSGTKKPQLSSCFLLGIGDDLDNIFAQIKQIGMISKWAGGIGIHMSDIRAKGSIIRGTNGISDGIIPLCIVLNKISRYVNQGGKRPGSIAVYLEPWHSDIFEFCQLREQNTGSDDTRARDLFLALWIPDLFMKRVLNDEVWSLMCPDECPRLTSTYGDEFEKLYVEYEQNKKYKKQVKARDLWIHIMSCQIGSGFPYMLYKDNVNNKTNHKNIGVVKSSNLCAEICEYSDENITAVCNLASICLPRYIYTDSDGKKAFDFDKLVSVVRVVVRNLNKVIDINYYPTQNARKSNDLSRPIGIGVQGLADVFNIFEVPYDSEEARHLNKMIFETIYFASLDESKELAKIYGHYAYFKGSPMFFGKLQYHMWGIKNEDLLTYGKFDWDNLVSEIKTVGIRNSLLTALMPTASTSQIMKCYESFEPYMTNMFVRTTIAGEFLVINENLVKTLLKNGIWSDDIRKKIIINNGSIQNIVEIPQNIKNVYKTAFELPLMSIIKQSADRGAFVDQSQSMNLFMDKPNFDKLNSAHFYGWKSGLKTGMYYLRTLATVNPIQFGIDISDVMRLTDNTDILSLVMSGVGGNDAVKTTKSALTTVSTEMVSAVAVSTETTVAEETENGEKMCPYIPGKKMEGCLSCGS